MRARKLAKTRSSKAAYGLSTHCRKRKSRPNGAKQDAETVIAEHFKKLMPAAVKHQMSGALWDLYNGPLSKADARAEGIRGWKGFTTAAKVLGEWADAWVEPVWYNQEWGGIETEEPRGYEDDDGEWVEPAWDDYVKYDTRDVKRAIFGSELAQAIR